MRLMLLALLLVACGGDDDAPTDAGTDSSVDAAIDAPGVDAAFDAPGVDAPESDAGVDATMADVPGRDVAPMNCEDAVGTWKSDDDMVFIVIESGCVLSNVCDLNEDTHLTGTMTSTEIVFIIPEVGELRFFYTLTDDTLTVHGTGAGGSDLVLTPLGAGESLPDTCPEP